MATDHPGPDTDEHDEPDEHHGHDHAEHDEHDADEALAIRRVERLRNAVLTTPADVLRAALQRLPEPTLREVASGTGMPAPVLRRTANPAARLRRLSDPKHLAAVAEALSGPALVDTVEELGESSDDPSHNQLLGALETVAEHHGRPEITVMLAYVAATGQQAAAVCDRILDEDERFAVSEPPEPDEADEEDEAPRLVAPLPPPERRAPDDVREARKARRQQEKEQRRRATEAARSTARKRKRS